MAEFFKSYFKRLGFIFVVSLVLAGVFVFFSNVLLNFHVAYRDYFWPLFGGMAIGSLMLQIFILPWFEQLQVHLLLGMHSQAAVQRADEKAWYKPPRFIRKIIVRSYCRDYKRVEW